MDFTAKERLIMRNNKKIQNLFLRGSSSLGMLAEAVAKAKLLLSRAKAAKSNGTDSPEFLKQVRKSMAQIKKDMAKYSKDISDICKELEGYGITLKDMG